PSRAIRRLLSGSHPPRPLCLLMSNYIRANAGRRESFPFHAFDPLQGNSRLNGREPNEKKPPTEAASKKKQRCKSHCGDAQAEELAHQDRMRQRLSFGPARRLLRVVHVMGWPRYDRVGGRRAAFGEI